MQPIDSAGRTTVFFSCSGGYFDALIPAFLMISAHFFVSALMKASN
jgi:hypothetical protein